MKNPKQVFEKLCEKAINLGIKRAYQSIRGRKFDKPGELINNLSDEDRKALKQLSSEDIGKTNILRTDFWLDETKPTELEKMYKLMENSKK